MEKKDSWFKIKIKESFGTTSSGKKGLVIQDKDKGIVDTTSSGKKWLMVQHRDKRIVGTTPSRWNHVKTFLYYLHYFLRCSTCLHWHLRWHNTLFAHDGSTSASHIILDIEMNWLISPIFLFIPASKASRLQNVHLKLLPVMLKDMKKVGVEPNITRMVGVHCSIWIRQLNQVTDSSSSASTNVMALLPVLHFTKCLLLPSSDSFSRNKSTEIFA